MSYTPLVHDCLRLSASRFPDKTALVCGEERLNYETVDRRSDQLADTLSGIGLRYQDRVAIFLDNSVESVLAFYGAMKAGGVAVILNGALKAGKLAYILQDSGARALIAHISKSAVVEEAMTALSNDLRIVWVGDREAIPWKLRSISETWNELIEVSATASEVQFEKKFFSNRFYGEERPLAALVYTSGSTGEPKGIMCSHSSIICAAQSIISFLGNISSDVILNVLPLSFDYGLYQVIMTFMFGGTLVLEKTFLYPVKTLEWIPREKVTAFPVVPTIAAMMVRMRNLSTLDLSSLRYVTSTGSPLPVEYIQKLRSVLPHVRLYSMYGLTECKRVSIMAPSELDRKPGSVGKPISCCSVKIVTEDGREAQVGEVGELIVKGANVMDGYWNSPELTAKVFKKGACDAERTLYTGDLFRMDGEGFLYFVGRKDDLIKSRGERVSPKEIEDVLRSMDGVAESAVIGLPDEILGQSIKAMVACEPNVRLTEKEVLKYCTAHLEPHMVPKRVEFLFELPKTPHGKIDKQTLRKTGCSG